MSGPSYHAQTHEKGGTDEVTTGPKVTDGGTTVDPATELDIGSGLTLTNPSAGVAAIAASVSGAAPLRFIHCQCILHAGGFTTVVPGNGTPLALDFFSGSGGSYITNDDPAQPGYGTVAGDDSVPSSAFTGDCFTTDVAVPTTQAFGILATPGLYLVHFSASFVPWPDPGPFRACIYPTAPGATFNALSMSNGAAALLNHSDVFTIVRSSIFIIAEAGAGAPPAKTPIGLTLQQSSGTDTDVTVGPTQAEILCVRLSPLPS